MIRFTFLRYNYVDRPNLNNRFYFGIDIPVYDGFNCSGDQIGGA